MTTHTASEFTHEATTTAHVVAIIPARYDSSRFPGKPLAMIQGKPMIQWVVERVRQVLSFHRVIVATDDERIAHAVRTFGGEVALTQPDHPSGTDRIWEVAQPEPSWQFIFNVQGDEPFLNPLYLEEAVAHLRAHHGKTDVVTLMTPIRTIEARDNPNIVKVVTNAQHHALYFSRAAIPASRHPEAMSPQAPYGWRHLGLYGYTRQALQHFVQLPPSPLEQQEQLEQLRGLEAGLRYTVLPVPEAAVGVDTPDDLEQLAQSLTPTL